MSRFALVATILWPWAFGAGPAAPADDTAVKPFQIRVEEAVLQDLQERLARTRFPDQIAKSGWDYGLDAAYLKELVEHWRTRYDWRAWESKLNQLDQFKTNIDGLDIHFIHQRSKEKKAIPLLLVHGWPGSFVEFYKVIGPLTDPVAHGGKAEDAFHVIVPSLPGFGFSDQPRQTGWSVSRMAEVMAKLMARLGYSRYGVQGGDWGAGVARWLGTYDADHVVGIHLNCLPGNPPTNLKNPCEGVPQAEIERMKQRNLELEKHRAYGAIQGTRPQTLGYALNDSPAGLAAWIIDKFWAWSDHGGNLDKSFTKDELLTNVMIYWVTQTPTSAARIYFERQFHTGERQAGQVPVGCALFPKEINVPPRRWVEAQLHVVHWTEMPRGGHFAALEQPVLLVNDVRLFFRKLK